ncbi:peptidyl-prolyl cis-trans isomerase A (cyclophilin A) [Balneicella halophila]|uniref:peptidylprolyl isomerase n=1 Tax=Balneicella halophila TaxID=1537566 RepID=A0A7L4UQV0_BALHA|nr:peptidylprolyl isomerase [Balneicella halophila]PVX51821.1 peptidyl-prolyl cis-trans isomerase A (cyclophilin A) [Balneicella halophila]
MKKLITLLSLALLIACTKNNNNVVNIEIETDLGIIKAELYPDKAPIASQNFIRYIKNNKFEEAHFYRVVRKNNQPNNDVKIEVIQGGLGFDVEEAPYPAIKHETTQETGILHVNGAISMARNEPGTASSEFFICIGDQPELDFGGKRNPDGQGFTAFGKVIEGMNVVREIQSMEADGQMLKQVVNIKSISIVE